MKPISEKAATPDVKAVFDDIKATRNVKTINNFWKYLANEPRMLRHTWESLKSIMGPGELDPKTKELVYLAVSITNNCEYAWPATRRQPWPKERPRPRSTNFTPWWR